MYCSNCGKKLEIEMDFKEELISLKEKGIRLIKRCRHCKNTIDSVLVKKA